MFRSGLLVAENYVLCELYRFEYKKLEPPQSRMGKNTLTRIISL